MFGSNSLGQCGLGDPSSLDLRAIASPTALDRLREYRVLDVCCGGFHTFAICEGREGLSSRKKLFGMGLNSSGQVYSFNARVLGCLIITSLLHCS